MDMRYVIRDIELGIKDYGYAIRDMGNETKEDIQFPLPLIHASYLTHPYFHTSLLLIPYPLSLIAYP